MIHTDQTALDEVAVIPGAPVARVEVARVEAVPVLTGLNQVVPVVAGRVLGVRARTARVHPVATAQIVATVLTVVAGRIVGRGLTAEAAPAVVAQIVATVLIAVAEGVNQAMSDRGNPVRPGMMTQALLFSQRSCPMLRQTS